jgi:putative methyltransferase (TIGR04325 family)
MITPKRILQSILPPLLWNAGKACKRRLLSSVDRRAYAPDGWDTRLPGGVDRHAYWTVLLDRERTVYERLVARIRGGSPLIEAEGEDVKYSVFGYVLALASRNKPRVSVLDYGGNLGEYYWLGTALVPGVDLEYHCKELPDVAASGRIANPSVTWHSDDGCLERHYDLVMFTSSIQYLPDWQDILRRAAIASRSHLLLSDVATVRGVPAYVGTSRSSGITTLEILLNRDEIVRTVEAAGLRLIREIPVGAYPPVAHAPEQPSCVSFLFQRDGA